MLYAMRLIYVFIKIVGPLWFVGIVWWASVMDKVENPLMYSLMWAAGRPEDWSKVQKEQTDIYFFRFFVCQQFVKAQVGINEM